MRKWEVTDIRWASGNDLGLPFWRQWNKATPLPNGFWQRVWEYPYLCSRIPQHGASVDVGGAYPFVLFPHFPNSIPCMQMFRASSEIGHWSITKAIAAAPYSSVRELRVEPIPTPPDRPGSQPGGHQRGNGPAQTGSTLEQAIHESK